MKRKYCHIKGLNIERAICHVNGNISPVFKLCSKNVCTNEELFATKTYHRSCFFTWTLFMRIMRGRRSSHNIYVYHNYALSC